MNYFDDETVIIESLQNEPCSSIYFPTETNDSVNVFESIYKESQWQRWTNSAGKSDPPPDFYCSQFQYMMDVMRIDDHAYKNKKGKVVNPVNIKESKIQAELAEKGILELFPNVNRIMVNAVTDLPTQEDHNYKFYKKNFIRIIEQHKNKIDLYRSNHPNYKLIFLVMDESSAYFEAKNDISQIKVRQPGDITCGTPHLHFFDEDFLKPIIKSDIDFLIWYTPFKLLETTEGRFDLPSVVVFDVKSINFDTTKYNEELMLSSEC